MGARFSRLLAFALAATLGLAARAEAQDAPGGNENVQLLGAIVDRRSEDPIPSARVNIVRAADGASAWSGIADEDGEFRSGEIPLGQYRVEVEAPPHIPVSEPLELSEGGVIDVRVEMVGVDYQLDPIVAVARRETRLERQGFYDRQRLGFGQFLTRADIEAQVPTVVTDVFKRMTGARVVPGPTPRGDAVVLARGGGCAPIFVLDGIQVDTSVPLGGVNERVSPDDLEAIEVYRGASIPARWTGLTQCGVVLFWSRESTGGGWLPSWKKMLAAGSIIGLAFFMTQ